MLSHIARRVVWFLPALVAIALATFLMGRALPGGPFSVARGTDRALPPQVVANLEAKYGLDKPLHLQFARYLLNALRGDFGPTEGYAGIRSNLHLILAPSIALGLTVLAFNFCGDGLRDALDPRLRGRA